MGDRYHNIMTALELLCHPGDHRTQLLRTSFLHQTPPMYVEEQPAFLNGAVEIETSLDPSALLQRVKWVEQELGRDFSEIPNGPRPVDLDLLFCDQIGSHSSIAPITVQTPSLIIPHPLMQEREFVLTPLREVAGGSYKHPTLNITLENLVKNLESVTEQPSAIRVLCLPRGRMLYFNQTIVMGILNVTPDSFSDGGKWNSSIDAAVQQALRMVDEGAGIIDIGGESTRPGAREVAIDDQIRRTVPIIQEVRKVSDVPISIDTRHSQVAAAAVNAGADIVNDVSGGTFDQDMLTTVASLGVPMIIMHMRGSPESMQTMTDYDSVVDEVIDVLSERSDAAEKAGIPRWLQVMDPGIGFAKNHEGNLLLLRNLERIRTKIGNLPILLGTSRKGFIGKLTGTNIPEDRDYGTIGSCVAALCLGDGPFGCNILRVHNVKASKDATVVMDAIRKAN